MAEFIYIEAIPIDGKIETPHFPMKVQNPDDKPYISAIAVDDVSNNQEED